MYAMIATFSKTAMFIAGGLYVYATSFYRIQYDKHIESIMRQSSEMTAATGISTTASGEYPLIEGIFPFFPYLPWITIIGLAVYILSSIASYTTNNR